MSVTNVEVELRDHESFDKLVKRFIRKCKKEEILEEYRKTLTYDKPSTKKRKERKERKRLLEYLERKRLRKQAQKEKFQKKGK